MLTVAIFTYKRLNRLNRCILSLQSNYISEILIFNDDEINLLKKEDLNISVELENLIKIFNPLDFGFSDRNFRKPIYLNQAVEIAKNELILFSDDDGIFSSGAIDKHYDALQHHHFSAGGIIRSRFINKK